MNLTYTAVTSGQERPIITPGTVNAGLSTSGGATPTNLSTCDEFIDPWGNVYDYRYRILSATNATNGNTTVAPYISWLSPNCLIVSCGAKYVAGAAQVPLMQEYWDNVTGGSGSCMARTGTIYSPYYDDVANSYTRSDNITSFSGR